MDAALPGPAGTVGTQFAAEGLDAGIQRPDRAHDGLRGRLHLRGQILHRVGDDAQAKAAYDKALKFVDRMTDREKLRTLGMALSRIISSRLQAMTDE